jgi:hypothetical protein
MTKTIQIILPNSNVINTTIQDDEGALFIYKKIQEINPGFNEQNLKIKKFLTEDDMKSGEKLYDFGNIRDGEKFITFIIEPCYEILEDIFYLTRSSGFNIMNSEEYVQSCRYHFKITDPIYHTTKSLSILYDIDFKKFVLEPIFHKRNSSVFTELKPFMSTSRPTFNENKNWSLYYNPVWYDTLKDLLSNITFEQEGEEGYTLSEDSIYNIEQLYEKHKLILYKDKVYN